MASATATCAASTRSSSPAASPTATTCAPARSRGSRRSWTRSSASPATAGSCSASATASRCCARRGCCRARCCRTRRCASSAARSSSRSSTPRRLDRAPARSGDRLSIPAKHTDRPLLGARPGARRARGQRPGRAALRRRARTSTARRATSRACATHAGNVVGLMPHPEHAVDPLTGSADGLQLFHSAARVAASDEPRTASSGSPTPSTTRSSSKLGREPNEVELAMFSLMWSEHCGYKHSRRLLKTLPTEGPRLVLGPGENAGAVAVGRRAGVRVQGRVAQPPERGRAVPGRGDRRRRDPARRVRDRRAPDRDPRLAALRRAVDSPRSRYLLERAVAGIGHYGNSIGVATVGGEIYFEAPYEQNCLVNAMCVGLIETERLIRSAAAGVGQRRSCCSARAPAATGSAARRCWPRAELDDADGQAPVRADRRPVRGEEAARVLAGAARPAGCSSRCRTSARPA